jgi:hypothetical protein
LLQNFRKINTQGQECLDKISESLEQKTETLVEQHDRYNFEAKMDYSLHKDSKISRYNVQIYFFIPSALHINEKTYPKQKFYADFTNHIRFKTPKMSLMGICNENNPLSPIYNICNLTQDLKNGTISEEQLHRIIYELRLLGAMYKSTIRDQFRLFKEELKQIEDISEINAKILAYLKEIEKFRNRFSELGTDLMASFSPETLRESCKFVDQYLSLQTQEQLTKLLKIIQKIPEQRLLEDKLKNLIANEIKHRRAMKSYLIRDHQDENESFTYWEGILKKFIQGILYLKTKDKAEERSTLQLLYGIAAGFAMFISLMIGLWIGDLFSQGSMGLVIALSIAYILKDRLKEGARNWSNKFVSHIFPDRKIEIFDIDGKEKIGSFRETARFMQLNQTPPEILKIRQASNISSIEQEGKPELVLRYNKRVRLYNHVINRHHQRHQDIFDIMRFNIRNFIQYADDAKRIEEVYNTESGQIEESICAKVYHLNLVLRLYSKDASGHEQLQYKKVRVILDQNGIKRFQEPTIHF